jgi:hypothetical protein
VLAGKLVRHTSQLKSIVDVIYWYVGTRAGSAAPLVSLAVTG